MLSNICSFDIAPVVNSYDFGLSQLDQNDSVLDFALEDAIIECLGDVLAVCLYSSRRDNLDEQTLSKVMMEGNLLYSRLHQLCLDQRSLFLGLYNTAKSNKLNAQLNTEHLISYQEALDKANKMPNREAVILGIEFIHNFQDLVKQRLLLVKPLLANPYETREVFDSITSFMSYECAFA